MRRSAKRSAISSSTSSWGERADGAIGEPVAVEDRRSARRASSTAATMQSGGGEEREAGRELSSIARTLGQPAHRVLVEW